MKEDDVYIWYGVRTNYTLALISSVPRTREWMLNWLNGDFISREQYHSIFAVDSLSRYIHDGQTITKKPVLVDRWE